jgi:superoxide dismutase
MCFLCEEDNLILACLPVDLMHSSDVTKACNPVSYFWEWTSRESEGHRPSGNTFMSQLCKIDGRDMAQQNQATHYNHCLVCSRLMDTCHEVKLHGVVLHKRVPTTIGSTDRIYCKSPRGEDLDCWMHGILVWYEHR